MKMIMAVINKADTKEVVREMSRHGFQMTRLAESGSFFGAATVTLMATVMSERLDSALEILRRTCTMRVYDTSKTDPVSSLGIVENSAISPNNSIGGRINDRGTQSTQNKNANVATDKEIKVGGANIFVLNVESAYKL